MTWLVQEGEIIYHDGVVCRVHPKKAVEKYLEFFGFFISGYCNISDMVIILHNLSLYLSLGEIVGIEIRNYEEFSLSFVQ
jgi:hypothetical protein